MRQTTAPLTIHIYDRHNDNTYYSYSGEGYGIFYSVISSEGLSDAVIAGDIVIGSDYDD